MAQIRTPLGRARGLGASKTGVGHFLAQRVTACALVLLVIWGAFSALALSHAGFDQASDWLRNPLNAGLVSLLAFAGFWHMQLGMRTIIEDYFQTASTKAALLLANVFVTYLGGALTIISILKVAFSSPGASV